MLNDDVRKESAKGRPNKLFEIMYTELLIEWDGMHRNCNSFFFVCTEKKKRNNFVQMHCFISIVRFDALPFEYELVMSSFNVWISKLHEILFMSGFLCRFTLYPSTKADSKWKEIVMLQRHQQTMIHSSMHHILHWITHNAFAVCVKSFDEKTNLNTWVIISAQSYFPCCYISPPAKVIAN